MPLINQPNNKQFWIMMRAIDIFSGVGGWSLGLKLAGIDIVSSYDIWGTANETNFKNNHHPSQTVDIRRLPLSDLPKNIDVVVGSPPCTQFSYSNRGGGGDLSDGIQDIERFLAIVNYLRPHFWIMENVPRISKIIENELIRGGKFWKYRHLDAKIRTYDLSEFQVPQKRKRCFVGNIDFKLLESYRTTSLNSNLGDIVNCLAAKDVVDPLYGHKLPKNELVDHVIEEVLSTEETRINWANKAMHPVYNRMSFPDSIDKPVRTITATCTRVSRESVVVPVRGAIDHFRRLTLRERATLQGFPIDYQFYGSSYAQKLKMIGNALPPPFAYLAANAMLKRNVTDVPSLKSQTSYFRGSKPKAEEVKPDQVSHTYPVNRTFKFSIPALHMKSGVRFELSNKDAEKTLVWRIRFFYGSSQKILSIDLDGTILKDAEEQLSSASVKNLSNLVEKLRVYCDSADLANLQGVWARKGPGRTSPFMFLDELDRYAAQLIDVLKHDEDSVRQTISTHLNSFVKNKDDKNIGMPKLVKNASRVLAGLIIGGIANEYLTCSNYNTNCVVSSTAL